MTLVRRIARPMLASMFVVGGIDAYRHPGNKVPAAQPVLDRLAPLGLPDDPELLVRANALTMVSAAGLLATGRLPRVAATALAASLVPTTLAGHRFWEESDPARRKVQTFNFFKNLSMLGGVLLAAVDTEGRPGLAYRAKMAGSTIERQASSSRREVRRAAKAARREARLKVASAHHALS